MVDDRSKSQDPAPKKPGLLRRFRDCTRGNALVLAAFGMPMIIGAGGFSIDFAQYYLWQRELQYAADQAAIAAAWELSGAPSSTTYSERALLEFQANDLNTAGFNALPTVELANYAGNTNNSVIVTAYARKTLPFTSFFTRKPTTVSVRSQAAFTGGAIVSQCLTATNDSAGGSISIGGNAVYTADCGIAALSNSTRDCTATDAAGNCTNWVGEDAIEISGTPYIDAGSIATHGTIDDDIHNLEDMDDVLLERLPEETLKDPFKDLAPPIPSPQEAGGYICKATGKGKKDIDPELLGKAFPGVYEDLRVSCDTVFQPGIYVIDGGELVINGNYSVLGSDIMFILINGAGFTINGTSQNGGNQDINLQGITQSTLENRYGVASEQAERMANMLIFEDPESEGSNPSGEGNGNTLSGTSDTWLSGAIYTPRSTLSIAGTAQVANVCLLMVADKVKLTGTMNMSNFCPDDVDRPTTIIFGTVRLVA